MKRTGFVSQPPLTLLTRSLVHCIEAFPAARGSPWSVWTWLASFSAFSPAVAQESWSCNDVDHSHLVLRIMWHIWKHLGSINNDKWLLLRQPNSGLFNQTEERPKSSVPTIKLENIHTLPWIPKRNCALSGNTCLWVFGGKQWFSLVTLLAVGGHLFVFTFSAIIQSYGGIFAYLINLMIKPWDWAHHLY